MIQTFAAILAAVALLSATACELNGQKQAQSGSVQLPGQRAVLNANLNVPPDEWAAPSATRTAMGM